MHSPRHQHTPRSLDSIVERIAREPDLTPVIDAEPTVESPEAVARRLAYEAAAADPRNSLEPTPEVIQQRVKRTALVPAIITVACADHDAAPGEFCFRGARGVCAARIIARAALR